jgi:hypothetical protein
MQTKKELLEQERIADTCFSSKIEPDLCNGPTHKYRNAVYVVCVSKYAYTKMQPCSTMHRNNRSVHFTENINLSSHILPDFYNAPTHKYTNATYIAGVSKKSPS